MLAVVKDRYLLPIHYMFGHKANDCFVGINAPLYGGQEIQTNPNTNNRD
jgi:hypothetical protein